MARDWAEEDEWLTKVDGVLAEHEAVNAEAARLVPPGTEPKIEVSPSRRARKR